MDGEENSRRLKMPVWNTMNSKPVSVIIPSYNRAHLLEKTLPAYLQDDVLELILVDDCSGDSTTEVVNGLMRKYPQIRYIRNEKNSKQCFSKNRGIASARGEYIYFGDDDSIITPDTIHILLETLQRHNADCVGARALYCGNYVKPAEYGAYIRWRTAELTGTTENVSDIERMRFRFDLNCREPCLPACLHAGKNRNCPANQF
jgi:glycosyltransferase involved in cell wall biosynthesis